MRVRTPDKDLQAEGCCCNSQTVRLADLLDEAKTRCKESLKEREKVKQEEQKESGQEVSQPTSEDEMDSTAAIMGYAAVKYMDLKNNRKTDYK